MKKFAIALASLMSSAPLWADTPAVVDAAKVAAVAAPEVPAVQKNDKIRLTSPRTGMHYVLTNSGNRPIVFQTEAMAAVNAQNVNRIVATNPALSVESQQMAMKNLLQLTAATQVNSAAFTATPASAPQNSTVTSAPNAMPTAPTDQPTVVVPRQ